MKLLKKFKTLAIILSTLGLGGCVAKAPVMEICIIDVDQTKSPSIVGLCASKSGEQKMKTIDEINRYIAIPSQDLMNYFRYCKEK